MTARRCKMADRRQDRRQELAAAWDAWDAAWDAVRAAARAAAQAAAGKQTLIRVRRVLVELESIEKITITIPEDNP